MKAESTAEATLHGRINVKCETERSRQNSPTFSLLEVTQDSLPLCNPGEIMPDEWTCLLNDLLCLFVKEKHVW